MSKPADRAIKQLDTAITYGADETSAYQDLLGNPIQTASGFARQHLKEVTEAVGGLRNQIDAINPRLSYPDITNAERNFLTDRLREASKLIDRAKGYLRNDG